MEKARYEQAEPRILEHLRGQIDWNDVSADIAKIPGPERQERLLSVFYYAAEAEFCVINTWATPLRFFRKRDVLPEKLEHTQKLEFIVETRRLLTELLTAYTPTNNESLQRIDTALDGFFLVTGYPEVRGFTKSRKITPEELQLVADEVEGVIGTKVLSGIPVAEKMSIDEVRLVLTAYTLTACYVDLLSQTQFADRTGEMFPEQVFWAFETYPKTYRGSARIEDAFPAAIERDPRTLGKTDAYGRPFPAANSDYWRIEDLFALGYNERQTMYRVCYDKNRPNFPRTKEGEYRTHAAAASLCSSLWLYGQIVTDVERIQFIRSLVENCLGHVTTPVYPILSGD